MKTRKHGQGLTHLQVVAFSNRLAKVGFSNVPPTFYSETDSFNVGWESAARYFAHELRVLLRETEFSTLNN